MGDTTEILRALRDASDGWSGDAVCVSADAGEAGAVLIEALQAEVARLTAALSEQGWQPIEAAPKDGTPLFLLVWQDLFAERSSNPIEDDISFRTIGHNNYDHDGVDCWQFAGWDWEQDRYTEARGKPSHWQPLPAR